MLKTNIKDLCDEDLKEFCKQIKYRWGVDFNKGIGAGEILDEVYRKFGSPEADVPHSNPVIKLIEKHEKKLRNKFHAVDKKRNKAEDEMRKRGIWYDY